MLNHAAEQGIYGIAGSPARAGICPDLCPYRPFWAQKWACARGLKRSENGHIGGVNLLRRQEVTKEVACDPLRDALSQKQELSSPGFDELVPICAQLVRGGQEAPASDLSDVQSRPPRGRSCLLSTCGETVHWRFERPLRQRSLRLTRASRGYTAVANGF